MSLFVPVKESPTSSPKRAKRSHGILIVVALIASLLGGGWYYFFGRKPKISMSVGLEVNGNAAARGLWTVGPGEVLLVGDGDVQIVDVASRKKKWKAAIPKSAMPDPAWQATMNVRFVRLQEWDVLISQRSYEFDFSY